jgi:hypothetical protein
MLAPIAEAVQGLVGSMGLIRPTMLQSLVQTLDGMAVVGRDSCGDGAWVASCATVARPILEYFSHNTETNEWCGI